MRPETLGLLVDIRDGARIIAEDTAGASYEEFLRDRRMRQLVERNLTIIGEAINRLRRRDPEVAQRVTGIQRIIGMRNVMVHRYDVIDYERVWHAIQETLPKRCRLCARRSTHCCQRMLADLKRGGV